MVADLLALLAYEYVRHSKTKPIQKVIDIVFDLDIF